MKEIAGRQYKLTRIRPKRPPKDNVKIKKGRRLNSKLERRIR